MKNFYEYLEEIGFDYTKDRLSQSVEIESNGEKYDFNDFAWHMLMNIMYDMPRNLWIKSMNDNQITLIQK